jgi:Mg-chelatase subunit ChlD
MSTGALRSGRRRIVSFVSAAVVLLAILPVKGVALAAVNGKPAEPLVISTIRVDDYPNLNLIATAPNSLSADEITTTSFRIAEGGEQKVVRAVRLPSDKLSVVLVIDTSKSMEGAPMDAARRAATTFVGALPAGVPVAVVGFGNVPTVASPFGTSKALTNAALARLTPRGNTTLYDAVVQALRLLSDRKPGTEDRQAVVLLTDGGGYPKRHFAS